MIVWGLMCGRRLRWSKIARRGRASSRHPSHPAECNCSDTGMSVSVDAFAHGGRVASMPREVGGGGCTGKARGAAGLKSWAVLLRYAHGRIINEAGDW